MGQGNISGVWTWTVFSFFIQIDYVLHSEGSLASIGSKIGRHVAWNCMNPLQVQVWENMISFFTTVISSDTTTHILSFLDTGPSACTIPSSNSFSSGYCQQDSLQAFFRAPQVLQWSSQKDFPLWPAWFHPLIVSGGVSTAVWVGIMVSYIKSKLFSLKSIHCELKQWVWRLVSSKNSLIWARE